VVKVRDKGKDKVRDQGKLPARRRATKALAHISFIRSHMELIRAENIHKTYYLGEIDVPVLNGVSFSINRGEMIALMGASGSGKTTLMNILGCLDRPTSGEYWFDGQAMSRLSPNERALVRTAKLGFVFQSFNLLPRTSALYNVLMPLDYDAHGVSHTTAHKRAIELLAKVGLSDRLDHEPSQMSGGQQQRVAIARALINEPALLLADEPTGNLDSHTSVEILEMFQKLNATGITVILVTHDPKVASYAHRTIWIADGLIERDGPSAPAPSQSGAHVLTPPPLPLSVPAPHVLHPTTDGNGQAMANGNGYSNGHPASAPAESTESGWKSIGTLGAGQTATAVATRTAPERLVIAREPAAEASLEAEATKPKVMGEAGWHASSLLPTTLRTALRALRRNKMRSALTALGIIIGVGAVIAMMEIGQGSKAAIQASIASMGANTLLIQSGAASSGGVSFGAGSVLTLTPQDSDEIERQCQAIEAVSPVVRVRAQAIFGNRNWVPMNIYGTTPDYLIVRDWTEMDEGDMFTDRDVVSGNKVCVVGETIVRELFQGQSPIGQSVRIQNVALRVVGVLSRKGANTFGMDQDDIIIAPWTTIKYRVAGNSAGNVNQSAATAGSGSSSATSNAVNTLSNLYPGQSGGLYPMPSATQMADTPQPVRFTNVDQIMAKARTAGEIPDAIGEVTGLLRERHHLRPDEADDFNTRDMTEITKTMTSTSDLMTALLLVVAMISLLVGGVGIMNIMLVSVTERTREIGLRMAVGARSHHILKQFLIEAVVLCLFGGVMGILLGRGASILVRQIMHWPTLISVPAIIAAFVVSVTVGIVFGFYPAWKASRLDPIEALRYE
jgi:macrolide transport system ATP-binding/permease protein